jgi:Tol biopolymer transport system component
MYSAERSLWVMDLATRDAQKLPGSEGLRHPRWSPDGKYTVAVDAESHLWLYKVTDHSGVVLTNVGAEFPTWSPDSKYVYFENGDFSKWYRAAIEGRRVEQVASLAGLHISFASMGWVGMTPQGAVISSRDVSTRNIYAIDWEMR